MKFKLSLTGAMLLAVLAPAGPAAAADPVWSYRNQATNRCMDDTSNGFRTWSCNGTNPQKWRVHVWPDGTVEFKNVNTGRCMQDSWGTDLITATCDESEFQSWWVKYWADGTRRFQNQYTLRCVYDSNTGFDVTFDCNTSTSQSWFRQ